MEAASIALLHLLQVAMQSEGHPNPPDVNQTAEEIKKNKMIMSLWLEKDRSDVTIKSDSSDLKFCWRYVKQNNPDKANKKYFPCGQKQYLIVKCTPESISLRAEKGKACIPLLVHFSEYKRAYTADIDTIVIDENVFDSYLAGRVTVDNLANVKCKNLIIRGNSIKANAYTSAMIVEILENITVEECLHIQIPVAFETRLDQLHKIPHVSIDIGQVHSDIATNAGYDTLYLMDVATPLFINNLLMFLTIGTSCNITTMRITIKRFLYRETQQFLRKLTHRNKRGKQDFHELYMRAQLLLMSTDGIDIRRSDGVLITVFVSGDLKAEEKTFTIYHDYPWDGDLSERMPSILEAQEENYKKYERLITEENNLVEKEKKRNEWLEKPVDEHGDVIRRDMLERNDLLEIKRNQSIEAIEKAKLEIKKHILERKLENGKFLTSVMCSAQKRKEFGFLSSWEGK